MAMGRWIVLGVLLLSSFSLAASLEAQLLGLINQARAQGVRCPGGGGGSRLPALSHNPLLAKVALSHALNMGQKGFLSHYYRGVGPRVRLSRAGYRYARMSEIIFKGRSSSPARAVHWWLRSSVHCRAIMNPYYKEFGAGFSPVGKAWAVVLAQPR